MPYIGKTMPQSDIVCCSTRNGLHLVESLAKGVPWTPLLKYYKLWPKSLLLFVLEQIKETPNSTSFYNDNWSSCNSTQLEWHTALWNRYTQSLISDEIPAILFLTIYSLNTYVFLSTGSSLSFPGKFRCEVLCTND